MGADISHGRALDECMDDNWGGGGAAGVARPGHRGGGQLPPCALAYSLRDKPYTPYNYYHTSNNIIGYYCRVVSYN